MYKVDLNCDLGESFGMYTIGADDAIMPFITSANIACGWHAGDPCVMAKSVDFAKSNNVGIGAHPGFNDLMGFGRREMNLSLEEAKRYVQYQVGALLAFCKSYNVKMQHVKLHGALYNMAAKNYDLAKAVCEGIAQIDDNLILLGLSGSKMIDAGKECGIRVANEVFADRGYMDDGTLAPRKEKGAVIHDANIITQRVIKMIKEKSVVSITGKTVKLEADSICVHGDNEEALNIVKNICKSLKDEKIEIVSLKEIV